MRRLVSLAVLLLAAPALAGDPPAAKPGASPSSGADARGQTSDASATEDPASMKGYGYGTPSGVESNASAGQSAAKTNPAKVPKAPQQEADHDSAQPNPRAAEQGQGAGPMAEQQRQGRKVAKKKRKAKHAKPAPQPAGPAAGEPAR